MVRTFNAAQRKVLADIGIAGGQLSAGSMVLPFVVPGLDQARLHIVLLGLLLTAGLWSFSVVIVKR